MNLIGLFTLAGSPGNTQGFHEAENKEKTLFFGNAGSFSSSQSNPLENMEIGIY